MSNSQALVFDVPSSGWLWHKVLGLLTPQHYFGGRGPLKLRPHVEPPLPGPEWCRVKTRLGGICGSDLALLTLANHPASLLAGYTSRPMGLGHENVAEVVEIGAGVGTDDEGRPWQVGDRVQIEPTLACAARQVEPVCRPCREGRFGVCENFAEPGLCNVPPGVSTGYNALTGGSWGPTFLAHKSQLVRPPETLSDEMLILTDPLACALHAVLAHPPSEGDHVLVWGGGIIGLATIAAIRAVGPACQITSITRYPHQWELAQALGADRCLTFGPKIPKTERFERVMQALDLPPTRLRRAPLGTRMFTGGYDLVYDAVGNVETVTDSLKFARSGGKVVLLGTFSIGVVDLTPSWFSEVSLVGSYGRGMESYEGLRLRTYQLVHRLMTTEKLKCADLLTHRFPLAQWPEALQTAMQPGQSDAVKVAFDFRE